MGKNTTEKAHIFISNKRYIIYYFNFNCREWHKSRSAIGYNDICPLCHKMIKDKPKDHVVNFLNNYTLFPNITGHSSCVEEYGYRIAVGRIMLDWLENRNKVNAWNNFLPSKRK